MKAEYGEYYILNSEKFYWCTALQREVRFLSPLVVKCDSGYGNGGHFGKLIDTSSSQGPDYETNNEIEFSDEDIIDNYSLKDMQIYYNTMIEQFAKIDEKSKIYEAKIKTST